MYNRKLGQVICTCLSYLLPFFTDRQKVKLATQLLSSTTADCLETVYPDDVGMKESADFIRLMDTWFDIFNCFRKIDSRKWAKSAFRINLEKSKSVLEEVIDIITNIKIPRKKALMFWQKAIIIDCKALMMLHSDIVASEYYVYYLITSRY